MNQPDWMIIQAENPEIPFDEISQIGEGWGAWAYRLNDEAMLKLPKRSEEGVDELTKEFVVLQFVHPHLPLTVPNPITLRQESAGWPHGYAIYSMVPGEEIDFASISEAQRSNAAKTLANFLRTLHGLEPSTDLRAVVPDEDPRDELNLIYERTVAEILPTLASSDATLIQTVMRAYLDNESNFSYTPTLTHCDLHNEHILWEQGRITGILDFGDALLSDPEMDFKDLYHEFGAEFTAACASYYGHADPARLVEKLREHAIFVALYDVLYSPEYGMEGDLEWAWAWIKEWLKEAKKTRHYRN